MTTADGPSPFSPFKVPTTPIVSNLLGSNSPAVTSALLGPIADRAWIDKLLEPTTSMAKATLLNTNAQGIGAAAQRGGGASVIGAAALAAMTAVKPLSSMMPLSTALAAQSLANSKSVLGVAPGFNSQWMADLIRPQTATIGLIAEATRASVERPMNELVESLLQRTPTGPSPLRSPFTNLTDAIQSAGMRPVVNELITGMTSRGGFGRPYGRVQDSVEQVAELLDRDDAVAESLAEPADELLREQGLDGDTVLRFAEVLGWLGSARRSLSRVRATHVAIGLTAGMTRFAMHGADAATLPAQLFDACATGASVTLLLYATWPGPAHDSNHDEDE